MNGESRTRLIGWALVGLALCLPACSSARYAANRPIAPSYVSSQVSDEPPTLLDPDQRLFLDPVSLTVVPTE
jgi:hypothetical protein